MDAIDTISERSVGGHAETVQRLFSTLHRVIRHLPGRLEHWLDKRASRRVLRDLTDSELLDIGLTRTEAMKEVRKSFFWDR